MEDNSISFLKSYKFYGEFEIKGCENKYTGHLVYTPKKEFYLDLIGKEPQENIFIRRIKHFHSSDFHKVKKIQGIIYCEETQSRYKVTLINPQATWPLRPSSKTRVFFDGLLFIAKHYGKGKLENIEIGYSGLEDFCCPEFYKGRLPYNRNNQPIEISEKQSIQFNERCNATWVDKDFFKNNFIASSKISDSDFEKICSDLNEVILPYENDLYFNNKIYHSVIVTSPLADFEEITSLNYVLRNLFMCLSDNFTMNTEVVTLHYEKNSIGYLLFPEMIVETQKVTKYPYMPFWQGLFDDNEWKTIFQNLFTKKKLLDNFFFILSNNARGEYLTQYSLVRSIDGLKAIGELTPKKTKNTAYSNAIENYIKDLEKKEQKSFNKFLDDKLKYVTLEPKDAIKPDIRGARISTLRGIVEHFYNHLDDNINLETLADLVHTFDFIIKDFVFKELGISNTKRLSYKRNMLHLYKILPTSYPKRKMYK